MLIAVRDVPVRSIVGVHELCFEASPLFARERDLPAEVILNKDALRIGKVDGGTAALRPAHRHDTDFLNASARIAASRRSFVLVHGQSLPLIWLSNN